MKKLTRFLTAPVLFVGIITLAFLLNTITPWDLNQYGIRPRSLEGLVGIPLVVFLHENLNHLANNAIPLLILGLLLRSSGRAYFIRVTIWLTLLSGLLTWLISPSALLVGASGLVFAYFSYLIAKAIRDKTVLTIVIAMVIILVYGGLVLSLTQFEKGVSWTGHISGFICGIFFALYGPKKLR